MIISSIEKMAEDIGYDIGHSNDEVQGKLLNGFCRGVSTIRQPQNKDMQLCYIVDKLTPQSKEVISILYDFIKIEEV